jgi:hypothetical protein
MKDQNVENDWNTSHLWYIFYEIQQNGKMQRTGLGHCPRISNPITKVLLVQPNQLLFLSLGLFLLKSETCLWDLDINRPTYLILSQKGYTFKQFWSSSDIYRI